MQTVVDDDDQRLINTALYRCKIVWRRDPLQSSLDGRCSKELKLTVSIVSPDSVCRHCDRRKLDKYYVWHLLTTKKQSAKEKGADEADLWFLKNLEYKKVTLKGSEWLESLRSAR